ncbi:MAG: hypothetical protein OXP12_02045 [Thaumarchaeota archaeon]|nr:hypothetical protein [Nitrososphaerota archaeon]MDE0526148.1 hypothetical protein [Nitrososphaerota archaeon]
MPIDDVEPGAAHTTAYASSDTVSKSDDEPVSEEMIDAVLSGVEAYKNGERFYTGEEVLKMLDADDES